MRLSPKPRVGFVSALAAVAFLATLCLPPIHEPQRSFQLADSRLLLQVPNFWNVASNIPFVFVGILAVAFLVRAGSLASFHDRGERWPYAVLFSVLILVGFGSSYFHWGPTPARLFWDRLPLGLVYASFLGVVIIDRAGWRWGSRLFLPIVLGGAASVVYWRLGNAEGRGDLRFYVLLQVFVVGSIPVLTLLFPPRYTRTHDLFAILGLFAASKIFEHYDATIFRLGGLISGHTLKHLLSALAAWKILSMVKRRRPWAGNAASPVPPENLVAFRPQD